MAISDTITSMYENVGNVYDVLELAGADLTNVDKNIENLKQSWKERLLYFLANGTDVIWNNWLPKINGTGETITLNNTIEAKMDFVYKGNTYQYSTTGKNLLDLSSFVDYTSNGVTFTNNNGIITATGTPTGTSWNRKADITLPAGTYTFSGVGSLNNAGLRIQLYTTDSYYSINSNEPTQTFTINEETLFGFVIWVQNTTNYPTGNVILTPMIESGSTATSFEEYTGGASPNPDYPQDIQVVSGDNSIVVYGKNLLPLTNQDLTINGVSFKAQNGKIIINGTATSNISGANLKNDNSFPITLKAGTYYFKRTSNDISTGLIDDNNNTIVSLPSGTDTYEQSFTLSSDKKLYLFFFIASGRTITNYEYELMISNTATTYEPYQSQSYPINIGNIELCKIGDYQDYFYKDNGKWYLHKEIGKVVLNGSEDWTKGSQTNVSVFVLSNVIYPQVYGENGVGLSNRFKYEYVNNANAFYFGWSNNVVIVMPNTYTLESFKTWLSSNNTSVYYITTPTYTEITDTTLIEQLDNLEKAYSYDTQTNISQTNNDMPFILDVTALGN